MYQGRRGDGQQARFKGRTVEQALSLLDSHLQA